MLWAGMRCPVGTRGGGGEDWVRGWEGVRGFGTRVDGMDGMDGMDLIDRIDRIDRIDLIDVMDATDSCEGAAQSDALGWYAAFLQNAEVGVLGYPERCSGLVCGVPLGHGAGEVRIGSGDGGVGVGEPLTR